MPLVEYKFLLTSTVHHMLLMLVVDRKMPTSHRLNYWAAVFEGLLHRLHSFQMVHRRMFCPSGGLYQLSNLINKASEICLLFIFSTLQGFDRAGKLPFSGTIFPRHCGAFLLFLMESDEHSQGAHCYLLASPQKKK